MKIINAGYEIMNDTGDMFKNIERVARVCYKSEDKICEGSAQKMVRSLVMRNHEAMLEHQDLIFRFNDKAGYIIFMMYCSYLRSKTGFNCMLRTTYYDRGVVSGNVRMWRDFIRASLSMMNDLKSNKVMKMPKIIADLLSYKKLWPILFDDIDLGIDEYTDFDSYEFIPITKDELTEEEKLVHYTVTVKFTVDIGVGREITRHRVASFAQESTRYCNYTKDGFGNEITVIEPCFFDKGSEAYDAWKDGCLKAERAYITLIDLHCTPQQARDVLPLSTKSELVMTATFSEWQHFFRLRALDATGSAHPQIKEVAVPLLEEMKILHPGSFAHLVK